MKPSEAVTLVAVLEAAFPRWSGGETTTQLFAQKLVKYDLADAQKGIDALVDHREDTTWPSWAEVARWIRQSRPRRHSLPEPETEPLSPAEIVQYAQRALRR